MLVRQGQEDDCSRPAQARQGQCNNVVTVEAMRERENGQAMVHTDDQRRWGEGGKTVEQH
jgi:hypothetical protein